MQGKNLLKGNTFLKIIGTILQKMNIISTKPIIISVL